ncbi:MAG TPA: hypothetical protein PLC85_10985 [Smithellaceae bacterium]|nr:hypothetical protein [Smithellaceae bacterium]
MEIADYFKKYTEGGFFKTDRITWDIPNADEFFRKAEESLKMDHLPEYDQIIDWMKKNGGRGLSISGTNGRGKTMIAKTILPLFFDYAMGKIVRCYHATEMNDNAEFIMTRRIVVLDDIGTEDQSVKFGERRWIFPEIVDHAEQKENILIITTNLPPDQIEKKYGIRTRDRLRAICTPVLFKGESLRK